MSADLYEVLGVARDASPEDIKKLEGAMAEALDGKPLTHVQPGPL